MAFARSAAAAVETSVESSPRNWTPFDPTPFLAERPYWSMIWSENRDPLFGIML